MRYDLGDKMNKFYLLFGLFLGVNGLNSMQPAPKDVESGLEVARNSKEQISDGNRFSHLFNKLSQNKKNAIGILLLSGMGLGLDTAKCLFFGCSGLDVPWRGANIAAASLTAALLQITSEYETKNKILSDVLAWVGLGSVCWAANLDLRAIGQTSLYYLLASPFFRMK